MEALENFFGNIPANSGVAFVVVTHQHPGTPSILPELLRKCTRMEVILVTDGMRVRRNCIHIIPAGYNLSIFNTFLHLLDIPECRRAPLPIDFFFRSLAEDQKDKSICVILSGTGMDGSLGLRAVKGEFGMVMVQEPQNAKFSGMPETAIATGLADYILPADEMGEPLIKYIKGPFSLATPPERISETALKLEMQKIFAQIRRCTGHDFSSYKRNTVQRCIERRMNIHHIQNPRNYVRYLQGHPQEIDLLFKGLLNGVTAFFRDSEVYRFLEETEIPRLLESRPDNYTVRVWVPGCANGEEAYSLAMIFRELLDNMDRRINIQIFGTDLDALAIDKARMGVYPESIGADVGAERLRRFFVKENNNYRIRKEIREMVIFALQNVVKDPPFTKLDFISCRNLLIYLDSSIQKKLLAIFCYALNPGGILFLGNSENIGGNPDLFKAVSKKWKVFTKKKPAPKILGLSEDFPTATVRNARKGEGRDKAFESKTPPTISEMVKKLLLSAFAPPSMILNEQGDIHYIHGRVGAYLEPAPGKPSHNALLMAREGIKT